METTEIQTSMQWFVFFNDQLLLKKEENNQYSVPCGAQAPLQQVSDLKIHDVTLTNGKKVKALAIKQPIDENDEWIMIGLRASYEYLPLADYQAAGKASQILYWDSHSRFCPVCGTPMEQKEPIMKKCSNCGNEMYPPVSTAVIVLIRKGNEILLVHARNFRGTFYGLVAGFLETGETLEECVKREVLEETGLRVKNITYFGNQPWPYPSGLMIGFIADYDGGEIKLQDEELSAAGFYSKDNLPEIPRKLSIARKLIDWWLENN
ncbi:NAD(+) diphosphatase [Bacteroides sp.]|uniref:NAD(+) diphosphatase n=1 Tax=Bacteroides sp. TaxID=29523 RepID=UPI002620C64D|nr:NAD(+) diphosphatase [Bacteroides sp.]